MSGCQIPWVQPQRSRPACRLPWRLRTSSRAPTVCCPGARPLPAHVKDGLDVVLEDCKHVVGSADQSQLLLNLLPQLLDTVIRLKLSVHLIQLGGRDEI